MKLITWVFLFISTQCEDGQPDGKNMNKFSPEENFRNLSFAYYQEGTDVFGLMDRGKNEIHELTCKCSWGATGPAMQKKIVGGVIVEQSDSHPMMAGLTFADTGCIICGASIITDRHVLTAAHCLIPESDRLYLTVGTNMRCKGTGEEGMHYDLYKKCLIHPSYNPIRNHYDIAICITKSQIFFNERVGPTCLHAEPFKALEDPLIILGWGQKSEGGEPSPTLHKVSVKMVEMGTCWAHLPRGWISEERDTQICTYASDKDACTGDSGGPLFWMDNRIGRLVQVALVSMGVGCARSDYPAINTAVYPFIGWIQTMIDRSSKLIDPAQGIGTKRRQICRIVPQWLKEQRT